MITAWSHPIQKLSHSLISIMIRFTCVGKSVFVTRCRICYSTEDTYLEVQRSNVEGLTLMCWWITMWSCNLDCRTVLAYRAIHNFSICTPDNSFGVKLSEYPRWCRCTRVGPRPSSPLDIFPHLLCFTCCCLLIVASPRLDGLRASFINHRIQPLITVWSQPDHSLCS